MFLSAASHVNPLVSEDADADIFSRFSEVAKAFPDAPAIVQPEHTLTYGELAYAARRLAGRLQAARLDRTAPVVILLPASGAWAVAALGVLAAGHFYVPLDPNFPAARNHKILARVRPGAIITSRENARKLDLPIGIPVLFDEITASEESNDVDFEMSDIAPNDLACVIFTSGSTGEPRGVVQTHRSVLHGIHRRALLQSLSASDRMTWLYSPASKATEYNFFGAVLHGASLHPRKIGGGGDEALLSWLGGQRITVYHSVASYFRFFTGLLASTRSAPPPSLRLIILGGERVLKKDLDAFYAHFPPHCTLFTGLGSTETGTIGYLPPTHLREVQAPVVPIGFPVEGIEIAVVDEVRQPVPAGVEGSILVRSRFISPGYWGETSDAFRRDPEDPEMIEYLSSDLGRVEPNGTLVHCGRSDQKVKVNGFLVNLAEVEAAALTHPGVEDAIAHAVETTDGTAQLGLHVLAPTGGLAAEELRAGLAERLPAPMVPAKITLLAEWPRLPNGKIDRQSLKLARPKPSVPDAEAVDPLQAKILAAWRTVLKRDDIDLDAPFTVQGGDSMGFLLLSLEFQKMGLGDLTLAHLIQNSTVRQQANLVHPTGDLRANDSHILINPLRTGTNGSVHFLVPPWGGGMLVFEQLIRHIHAPVDFYSLELAGVEKGDFPFDTFEDATAPLAAELLRRGLTDTYWLSGYSSGGLLALELAQRLQESGAHIAGIILLDTLHPEVNNPKSAASKWAFGTEDRRLRQIRKHWSVLESLPLPKKLNYLADRVQNKITHLARGRRETPVGGERPETALLENKHRFFDKYQPRSYDFDLTLVKATELDKVERWLDPTLGWRDYIRGHIDLIEIPVTHSGLLLADIAPVLADAYGKITGCALQTHGNQTH